MYAPAEMRAMLRNAYFLLAREQFMLGERLRAEPGRAADAEDAYRQAYETAARAGDRLGPEDDARRLFLMAETSRRLGRETEAANLYRLSMAAGAQAAEGNGARFWADRARDRLNDQREGYGTGRISP
jgi:hypothetical protein